MADRLTGSPVFIAATVEGRVSGGADTRKGSNRAMAQDLGAL